MLLFKKIEIFLYRKQAFLHYENISFKKIQNFHFWKGVKMSFFIVVFIKNRSRKKERLLEHLLMRNAASSFSFFLFFFS